MVNFRYLLHYGKIANSSRSHLLHGNGKPLELKGCQVQFQSLGIQFHGERSNPARAKSKLPFTGKPCQSGELHQKAVEEIAGHVVGTKKSSGCRAGSIATL